MTDRTPNQLRYLRHRQKYIEYSRRWIAANPERHRELATRSRRRRIALKRGYLPCIDYPPPPADGCCAICSQAKKLYLDHDHSTGAFRGYLCNDCNMGLGKLGDDLPSILKVVEYLQKIPS